MNQKRDIELIILEVLGCLDEKDKKNLKFLKENDEAFCWRDLAEYQNLTALISSTLNTEIPSSNPKEILVKNLNRIIFGKENIGQTEKYVLEKKNPGEKGLESIQIQDKIDWDSLAVPNSEHQQMSGFREVKSKTHSDQINIEEHFSEVSKQAEEENEGFIENSAFHNEENVTSSPSLKKYILVSISLFVVIALIVAYMFLNNDMELKQVAVEIKPVDSAIANLQEFVNDSLKEFEPLADTIELQELVVLDNSQKEQNVLPKAPPKLPDPIEAPLIAMEEVVNEEESKIKEEISAPPPKEVIEETEEPTFFVAVEEMPQPIGGLQGIQGKIKYPEIAKRAGVEGKVFVRAFVDEMGIVVSAEILKGIGAGCDEAALDAILKTKFTPGKQRGKPIKVQVTVPVLFKL